MTKFKIITFLSIVTLLAGCAGKRSLMQLYDGPILPRAEVVSLLYPSDISMVLYIDGKIAGGSCFSGCGFRQPVQILPGNHKFVSSNMHMGAFPKGHISNPIPTDGAHSLELVGSSLLSNSFAFSFEESLEAGKTYALNIGYTMKNDDSKEYFIWWTEMPKVPLE